MERMSAQPISASNADPLLDRLERLNQRRSNGGGPRTPPTQPFAPPSAYAGPATPPAHQPRRSKRHHPARIARLGALAISCASTGGLTYLFADINTSQAASQALAALPAALPTAPSIPVASATTTSATTTAPTTTAPVIAASATTPTTLGPTTSTSAVVSTAALQAFNGELVNTRYGPVQVQLQITDGAISEVVVVAYPDGDDKSVRINARALPTLRTEVLTAQSAQIDTVSGATYTSDAYTRSLQSAIDQARTAGTTTLA